MGLFQYGGTFYLCLLLMFRSCNGAITSGRIYPGFEASQMDSIDNAGLFLLSNKSVYGFGFQPASDVQFFSLAVIHLGTSRVVWTANRVLLVNMTDNFVFEKKGNVYLQKGNTVVWSTNTSGLKVTAMELRDSGNLVLLGDSGGVLWQSFSYPTDALLSGQEFLDGMRLERSLTGTNLSVYLEFKSGDLVLFAGYQTPQVYWSLSSEVRKIITGVGSKVHSATLEANAWNFYDQNKTLLSAILLSADRDHNATWVAILDSDGAIALSDLQSGESNPEPIKMPQNSCSVPEPCGPYYLCLADNRCQCPMSLSSQFNCKPPIASTCNSSKDSTELVYVDENLDYFALGFVTPFSGYSLDACKEACLHNCSCSVLFFENTTHNCFLFDQIGSLQSSQQGSGGYVSYMKFSSANGGLNPESDKSTNGRKNILIIVIIIVGSVLLFAGLLFVVLWQCCRKKRLMEFSKENLEEDHFLDNVSGMPVRFSYCDLCQATKGFSTKIGQGGFASVYLGMLPDGTRLAVKKLDLVLQ